MLIWFDLFRFRNFSQCFIVFTHSWPEKLLYMNIWIADSVNTMKINSLNLSGTLSLGYLVETSQ